MPLLAFHRDDGAFGQGGRDGRKGPGVGAHLGRVGQDQVCLVGVAVEQVGGPLDDHRGRPPWASRAQPGQRGLRVGPHLGHAVAAQQPTEHRQVALHGAAVRRRRRDRGTVRGAGPAFGGIRPAFGRRRPAHQRVHPGPEHRHRRVVVDQPLVLEPSEPPQGGLDPSAGVGPEHQAGDQTGHPVDVTGGLGVVDGQLGQPVALTPGGRPSMEPRDQLGLTQLQLGSEQLPEQLVVAVPLALAVQRRQQQVGVLQRLQHPARPAGGQDRVTQRPRETLQHRRAGQELHQLRREMRQQLRPQVVGHEPVVPGESEPGLVLPAAGLDGERGQVQPDRPPLGPTAHLRQVRVGQPDTGTFQQGTGLPLVHGQLVGPDLHHLALGPQQGHRQGWHAPGGQQQLRPCREPHRQLGHRVDALAVVEQLDMVQDQRDRLGHRRDGGREPREHGAQHRDAGRCQRLEHSRVDRLHPVQRDRDIAQQDHRVVVAPVDRDPGDPIPLPRGPLGQDRGLAIAGRGDHTDEGRGLRVEQPLDQLGPGYDPRPGPGRMELGLQWLEQRPQPGLLFAASPLHPMSLARRVCPAQRGSSEERA